MAWNQSGSNARRAISYEQCEQECHASDVRDNENEDDESGAGSSEEQVMVNYKSYRGFFQRSKVLSHDSQNKKTHSVISLKPRFESTNGSNETIPSRLELLIGRSCANEKRSEESKKLIKFESLKNRSVSGNKNLVQLIAHSEKQQVRKSHGWTEIDVLDGVDENQRNTNVLGDVAVPESKMLA